MVLIGGRQQKVDKETQLFKDQITVNPHEQLNKDIVECILIDNDMD